jgi:hypothetical protein
LLRPLGEVQCHGRRLDRCARIFFEDNPCAQRPHGRVGDAIVFVLREPGSAKEERCCDGVLQADPCVAPGLDIRPVGTLAH